MIWKTYQARKVLEVAFQNAKEKTLKPSAGMSQRHIQHQVRRNQMRRAGIPQVRNSIPSILKSGTWSHRMPEWMILINPAQPLQTENGRG